MIQRGWQKILTTVVSWSLLGQTGWCKNHPDREQNGSTRGWFQTHSTPQETSPTTQWWRQQTFPEQVALFQFMSYPVGLGYFSQGETHWGISYAGFQLGSLALGALFQPDMKGSSFTHLFSPLTIGTWLISIAHSSMLAKQRNIEIANTFGLTAEDVSHLYEKSGLLPEWGTRPYQKPNMNWQSSLIVPLILQGNHPPLIAPGLGFHFSYQVGAWLADYMGDGLEPLHLTMDISGFYPLNTSPSEEGFAAIKNAGGFGTDLGLSWVHPSPNLNLRYGFRLGRRYRVHTEILDKQLQWAQASYQGGSLNGGVDIHLTSQATLALDLDLGYFFPMGQSGEGELPGLLVLTPGLGLSWWF